VKGGTNLTITGDGFDNSTVVVINGQLYYTGDNKTHIVSKNMIVVTTHESVKSSQTVQVYVDGAEVIYNRPLVFNYSEDATPVVFYISPSVITGSGLITLIGQNFGKFDSPFDWVVYFNFFNVRHKKLLLDIDQILCFCKKSDVFIEKLSNILVSG